MGDGVDGFFVVAPDSDADEWFSAGGANEGATLNGFEFGIVIFDEGFGFGLAKGGFLLGSGGHIDGELGVFCNNTGQFAE